MLTRREGSPCQSGALGFWAPSDGARLGISAHARTELRGTGTFTLGQGSAGLTETVTVTQVPAQSQDIIIGQMFPSGTTPFAMLHYTGIGSWIGDTMHFQAGDYQQDLPGSPASDGGRVTFSALSQSGVSTKGVQLGQWTGQTGTGSNQDFSTQ